MRQRLRCCHGSVRRGAKHSVNVDPSLHRNAKTKRTNCPVKFSIRRISASGFWHITSSHLIHNHDPITSYNTPIYKPPTAAQKTRAKKLLNTAGPSLGRSKLQKLLNDEFPDRPLSLNQASNLVQSYRNDDVSRMQDAGGDIALIVQRLSELKAQDPRWVVHFEVNPTTRQFEKLYWSSPGQVDLLHRWNDVIINDITLGRNKYNLPLNIFVIVDGQYVTQNVGYSFLNSETTESHQWALRHLFGMLPLRVDRVFVSDHDLALEKAIELLGDDAPFHLLCLHHLAGNFVLQLKRILLLDFDACYSQFWLVYYSLSPDAFEAAWTAFISKWPLAAPYLNDQLYPTRKRWAWCYVKSRFTAGVRTSGRIERENRVNRDFGDSSTPLHTICDRLISRSIEQDEQSRLRKRQVSHPLSQP